MRSVGDTDGFRVLGVRQASPLARASAGHTGTDARVVGTASRCRLRPVPRRIRGTRVRGRVRRSGSAGSHAAGTAHAVAVYGRQSRCLRSRRSAVLCSRSGDVRKRANHARVIRRRIEAGRDVPAASSPAQRVSTDDERGDALTKSSGSSCATPRRHQRVRTTARSESPRTGARGAARSSASTYGDAREVFRHQCTVGAGSTFICCCDVLPGLARTVRGWLNFPAARAIAAPSSVITCLRP